jgi:hypothetical protein
MNSSMSIYIPRLSILYTENDVKYTFRLLNIGEVNRVDFVAITNKDTNEINDNFQSAFVHFEFLYDTAIAQETQNYLYNNMAFKLWVEENVFWWILNNNNPIPETKLNIHQLAENMRLLEEKVKQQEELIEKLQNIIMNKRDDDNDNRHIRFTNSDNTFTIEDNENDDDTIVSVASTHSSMPGLTPINVFNDFNDFINNYHYNDYNDSESIYSNSSMPELISSDSDSSKNRVDFTKEYCDNY